MPCSPTAGLALGSLLTLASASAVPHLVQKTNGSCLIQTSQRSTLGLRKGGGKGGLPSIAACRASSHCVVPAGETWILDRSIDLDTLTIRGTLEWDSSRDGLELRAAYVVVEDGGHLKVGTRAAPMDRRATIHIKKGRVHPQLGARVLGGLGSAKIEIHGRRLRRTWTLLQKTAFAGSLQLFLKDDPEKMGWRAGDRIGLATTTRGESSVYTVASIAPPSPEPPSCPSLPDVLKTCSTSRCKVLVTHMQDRSCRQYCARSGLACVAAQEEQNNDCSVLANMTCDQTWPGTSDLLCECEPPAGSAQPRPHDAHASNARRKVLHLREPLQDEHWGGWREVAGRRLEMAAEVVNLERSVLITGDHEDFYSSNTGLHTLISGTGYMDMRYARVEYCGQRDLMGRYCLHFHRMARCPLCVFEGNSVVDSAQVGITIHGTHDSLVSNNIIWDARAAGIYTEDGNEMNNLITQNVIICSRWQICSVNWLDHVGLHAGIYLIGMTNDLIENRIAGHENCIWTPGGSRGDGSGAAFMKVCPMYTPFGEIRGNVNHDCQRFGLYLDNQFPRNIRRDENGFVTDLSSCQKFTADGQDNGVQPPNVIRDEFDWHNMFVGQYNMGDVMFVNYTGVNNFHSMYWKSSKDFADGQLWHVKDSAILNDPSDPIGVLQFFGPGGPHVFGIQNTIFAGGPVGMAALCAGQHCGLGVAGGPCDSQYLLEGVDFSGVQTGGQLIEFGVHSTDAGRVLPVFLARDNSLNGFKSLVSQYLNGFGEVAGCKGAGAEWGNAIGCSSHVRRLNVWGWDSGDLQLNGPGYGVAANRNSPTAGLNAGRMVYEGANGKGYGAPVLVGSSYSLEPQKGAWNGEMVLDFSDRPLGAYFGNTREGVSLTVGGSRCHLRASDDRRFLGPKGPVPRILHSHHRIQAGKFLCASANSSGVPLTPPSLSLCSGLPNVLETCSADGCRVLTQGMKNRACTSYCRTSGLFCTGAWESAGDGCAAVLDRALSCHDTRPLSDRLICECSPEPSTSTTARRRRTARTTTLLPPGVIGSAPASGTRSPTVPQCRSLPNVKARCSEDGCKVLAGGMTGLTCAEYCARSSMECMGAWEDRADDCAVKATMACHQVWPNTSDLICQCASVLSTTTIAAGAGPPLAVPQCNLNHPGVKEFCSASGCKVLVGGMAGRSCETFCAESKLFCIGVWQEVDDTCREESALRCNQTLPGAGDEDQDVICECSTERRGAIRSRDVLQGHVSTTASSPAPPASWLHRQGLNCYNDVGARGIPGKSPLPGKFLLEDCKRACELEPRCQGVVMVRQLMLERNPYFCWLKMDLTVSSCLRDTAYDLWQRLPSRRGASESTSTSAPQSGPGPGPRPLPGQTANNYERRGGVGAWGGWCTCPDGQRYNVGDLNDACAGGRSSLACYGGTPGRCERRVDDARRGMQVTCAAPLSSNRYERASDGNVGGWGGWCTCPDGQRYNVGDLKDGCAQGPASLACFGGTPGTCERTESSERKGMQVTCAPRDQPQAATNLYEHSSNVGGWGGWCTCPDGQRYAVGDLKDGCAKGPASLACIGGTPGECRRQEEPSRKGMRVTCGSVVKG